MFEVEKVLAGKIMILDDREIELIMNLLMEKIEEGTYLAKMREYLNLYDKFEKLV